MHHIIVNCLLLASVVVALPNVREKRHLSYIKNILNSVFFGSSQNTVPSPIVLETAPEYKLFQLPGFEDILIKVAPKNSVVEKTVYSKQQPVNLNAFGSVVGTKSTEETQAAMKNVNNLLSSSILAGQHDKLIKKIFFSMYPTLNSMGYIPVLEKRNLVRREVIKPHRTQIKSKVSLQPQYVFEQSENNEPATMYTAHTNPYVKVEETMKIQSELPTCIRKRIDDVILLGADPYQVGPIRAVFPIPTSPVVEISALSVEVNPYLQNPLFALPAAVFKFRRSSQPLNSRSKKSYPINSRPLPLNFIHRSPPVVNIRAQKANVTTQINKESDVLTNLDNKLETSQTLGLIPPQYILHTSNKVLPVGSKLEKTNKQINDVINVSAQNDNNVSNGTIPGYVYKNISPPPAADMFNKDDRVKTNFKTHTNSNENLPSNYSYIPSIIKSEESTMQDAQLKEGGVHIKRVTLNPDKALTNSVASPTTNAPEQNSLKENVQTSFESETIVEPEVKTNNVNQQTNADSSLISMKGDKTNVAIDAKESNTKGRGDIPDD